uniref:F5/8 type C domain-containing protein n=1 Tax=Noctiluca scintillans TaxID=2966 RepID=A0A7S1ACC5_NOCSC|mmetsp:Transcript_4061/g.11402  ORF Transcript_4061/g.11402 Transcript_4061/m.11402 type:complete len:212 (+) Transcript_4061:99-734(+)
MPLKPVSTRVLMASSLDEQHPEERMIEHGDRSFWISTGLFPQEIMLELRSPSRVSTVKLSSTHIKAFQVEGCPDHSPINFTVLCRGELKDMRGQLQFQELKCPDNENTNFIKLVILSGWCDFCTVHRIEVDGEMVDEVSPVGALDSHGVSEFAPSAVEGQGAGGTGPLRGMNRARTLSGAADLRIPRSVLPNSDEPLAPRQRADSSPWEKG